MFLFVATSHIYKTRQHYALPVQIMVVVLVVVVAFSSPAKILGEWSTIHFPPALFFFFFFQVKISSRTLIPLFRLGSVHSGWARRDECDRVFPDELRVSSFPDKFPGNAWTAAQSADSDFVGSRVYTCLGVTCYMHFWQNDWGLLRAT